MYEYAATIIRWIDADTAETEIRLGFYLTCHQRLRLLAGTGHGVNAPEMHSAEPAERRRAQRALARSAELAPAGQVVQVQTFKPEPNDAFGRYLAAVTLADGRDLGGVLLSEGLASPYVRG